MSINWVMLSQSEGFTPLQGEQRLYSSPLRTALKISSINKFPGKKPFTLQSNAGVAYLTNRRVVYLPANPTSELQSFSAPILNLHDTHAAAPIFGPNTWTGIVQCVPGGNIPPEHPAVEIKITFYEGGAFDFHSLFERVKERIQHAVEIARESGQFVGDGSEVSAGRGEGGLSGVNLDAVHLDELPAYEDAARDRRPDFRPEQPPPVESIEVTRSANLSPQAARFSPPDEPPPGYETVQAQGVADELERRLRGPSLR